MESILDPLFIAEIAAMVATTMQTIKSHPKVKGSTIPYLSGMVGVGLGVGWYFVSGALDDPSALLGVDWMNLYRGVFNGIAGAVTANASYNIQKALPIPNILPTANEMDAQAALEQKDDDAVG